MDEFIHALGLDEARREQLAIQAEIARQARIARRAEIDRQARRRRLVDEEP